MFLFPILLTIDKLKMQLFKNLPVKVTLFSNFSNAISLIILFLSYFECGMISSIRKSNGLASSSAVSFKSNSPNRITVLKNKNIRTVNIRLTNYHIIQIYRLVNLVQKYYEFSYKYVSLLSFTQCAAVRTCLLDTNVPPQSHCILCL